MRAGLAVFAVLVVFAACGGDDDESSTAATSTSAPSSTTTAEAVAGAPDLTRLPIGDGKVSTAPEKGSVFSCQATFGGGGAFRDGPWIKADGTFDLTATVEVDGAVEWPGAFEATVQGATRVLAGNGVPRTHPTGTFPVAQADDAYQYDRNPNTIRTQNLSVRVPAEPKVAATPTCVGLGSIGVATTGVVFFNALDALGRDAVAHEVQDGCEGHPERSGSYHYHSISDCVPDEGSGHSPLVGYAYDGFGIYGHRGEDGRTMVNADLDECHGHTHAVAWDGGTETIFHYHATWEYPYTVGCFRGTPATT